jgi:hypothetical protein
MVRKLGDVRADIRKTPVTLHAVNQVRQLTTNGTRFRKHGGELAETR